MSQNTIQQAIEDIQRLAKKHSESGEDIPLGDLLRPWLAITDLDIKDALEQSAADLWANLRAVHTGLSGYLAVMGSMPNPTELQEAACRLMASFSVAGTNIVDGDISLQQKMTIVFEGGVWVYITDPKLRMRETTTNFREALAKVREMLQSD
jgi:hypothetical protein